MKYIKCIALIILMTMTLHAKEEVDINFKDLEIIDLVKLSAKILNKNILITEQIDGKVDFISNKTIYKDDLLDILIYVLDSKGYTIVDNDDILRVVKIADAARNNLPIRTTSNKISSVMATEIIPMQEDANLTANKIRHLLSPNSKLIVDSSTNSLIITDYQTNLDTVKQILKSLQYSKTKEVLIINLQNLRAINTIEYLQQIIKSTFPYKSAADLASAVVDEQKNSVVLIGYKEDINQIYSIIEKLDKSKNMTEKKVEVITLENIDSKSVMNIINESINKMSYKSMEDRPMITGDEETNSIIVIGNETDYKFVKDLITKLDTDKQQVYVQARIIEVSEQKTKDIGIKYGIEGLKTSSTSALTFASNLGASPIQLSESVLNHVTLPNMIDGIMLGASIKLLNENGALDVVSEPSILCINNKESSIYVGETRTIPVTMNNGTTTTTSYEKRDIGLKLKVKPRISSGEKVTLEVEAILEDIKNEKGTNNQPDTTKKEVQTLAIVNNGESVILGGLIKNKLSNNETKVPLFGDIPLLGYMFRNNASVDDKINLVIVLTPYIISKTENLANIRNKLAKLKEIEDSYAKKLENILTKGEIKSDVKSTPLNEENSQIILGN
jgi:general secretion pathway protein D